MPFARASDRQSCGPKQSSRGERVSSAQVSHAVLAKACVACLLNQKRRRVVSISLRQLFGAGVDVKRGWEEGLNSLTSSKDHERTPGASSQHGSIDSGLDEEKPNRLNRVGVQ